MHPTLPIGSCGCTKRYTVISRMTPAWAGVWAIHVSFIVEEVNHILTVFLCPWNTTFEEKGGPKRYRTEVLPFTSVAPYRWAKPAHEFIIIDLWVSTPPRTAVMYCNTLSIQFSVNLTLFRLISLPYLLTQFCLACLDLIQLSLACLSLLIQFSLACLCLLTQISFACLSILTQFSL